MSLLQHRIIVLTSVLFACFGMVDLASAQVTPGTATYGTFNNSSSATISYTNANGSNKLLVVGVSAQQPGGSVTSITYNGNSLTKLGTISNSSQTRIEIWFLKSPQVGTANVVVTNSQSENGIIGVMSFAGVNQTTPFGTLATAQGSGTTASVSASSAVGELVYSVVAFNNWSASLTPGSGQTEYWDQTINSSVTGSGSTKAGAASVSMQWTSTNTNWTIGAVSIKAASIAPAPIGLSVQVNAGSDDAEESLSSGAVSTSSNDLELAMDGSVAQLVGMRFNGITIPAGATITSAYVEFETDVAWSSACNLTVKGQAADNPSTFTTASYNLSSRTKTTASVPWVPAAWNIVDQKQQTPDLTNIIQEIVNRSGWSTGNSMVVFVDGTGTREAESYEGEAAAAPLLVVNYSLPQPNNFTKSIVSNSDDAEEEGPEGVNLGPGGVYLNSTDLEVVADFEPSSSGTQKIGLRFTALNIPSDAIITSAYLTFGAISADSPNTNNGATNLTIKAQAADNPATFTNSAYNISNRPTTSSLVAWTPSSWTTGISYNSPDLSPVVQEIISRPGWMVGNSMVFIITGTGSRSADSYDGNPSNAPKLVITYTSPSPGGVTGSCLWLKADAGAGTTTEGATISNWLDQSGAGNSATTSVNSGWTNPGVNPPVYRKGASALGMNFNPSIDFTGNKSLDGIAGFSTRQSFIVFKNSEQGKAVVGGDDVDGGGGGAQSVIWYWTGTLQYFARNNSGNNYFMSQVNHSIPNGSPLIFDVQQLTNTTGNVLFNGGGASSLANTGTPPAPFTGAYRLNKTSDNNYPANGQIAEVISFNSNLSTTNRQKVTSYLGLKYGITLSHNYQNSAGTTIYNVSTHGNNIAGIAQDDASSLNQKQSKSVNAGLQVLMGLGNAIAVDNAANTGEFSADKSSLIWGDNAGSVAAWTATGAPSGIQILARTWKVQETGIVDSVLVQIADNSGTNGLPNEGINPVSLLIDADGNFTSGAILVPMTLNGNNWEAKVDFTSGQYFTFGKGCTFSLASTQVDITPCYGNSNGAIHLVPSGGIAPYNYIWSDIGGTGNLQNRTGITAGEYKVAVTDAASCAAVAYFSITQPASITLSGTVTPAPANSSSGAVDLTVANGVSPYAYAWTASGGGVIPSGQNNNQDLTGLVAGTYSVTVTDAGSCTSTANYLVHSSVYKQLYLSDPSQSLDRIDPVATADGTTATSGAIAGSTGCSAFSAHDNFNSVSYNNYPTEWTGAWSESSDDGSPTGGTIQIVAGQIRFQQTGISSYIQRSINLSSASCPQLSYFWSTAGLEEEIEIWISSTANGTFTKLAGYTGQSNSGNASFDISAYISSQTTIRFWNSGATWSAADDQAFFDNILITYGSASSGSTTFTQSPALCSPLQMPAGGALNVKTYLSNITTFTSSISAASTSTGSSTSVASGGALSFSHTPGTGSNRLLLVAIAVGNTGVSDEAAPGTVTGVTFGGTPMTLVKTVYSGSAVRSYIYRLLNPTASPSANVVISIGTKTSGVIASATTFNGVDQTTPLGTPVSFVANGFDYFVTGNVTSASGEVVFSTASLDEYIGVQQGISAASGQTELWNNSGFDWVSGASSTKPGASSVTLTYNMLDYEDGCIAAVSIKPATTPSGIPANPNISAVLKYGTTTFATLTNPTYSSGTGLLTWSQTLISPVSIPAGQSISLVVTNNESGISFKIDHDSQTKPSRIELPVSTYIDITSYDVYNAAYPGGSIITNAIGGNVVYPRAVVSDPFGFSDITGLNITISPPLPGSTVAATSVATSACTRTYQYTWTTPFSSGSFNLPATAKEGFENTVTDLKPLSFDLCSPTIGAPVFALGANSARCQGAGNVTYSASSTSSTGISYSLDAASLTAGNTISSVTGIVNYVAGWGGTTTIIATATGCGGPKTATHTVTVTPNVSTPLFNLGTNSVRCQGAGTVTYTATAINTTDITYTLDATSISAGNNINATSGAVTYTAGWAGTSTITASAAGCGGPKTATHTVTHTMTVTTPVFALGASSTRCQGSSSVTYTTSASNSTGITYSLDAASIAAGNVINATIGVVTYAANWSGTSTITASANGCNGPTTAMHTVTITPNGTLTFALGATSARAAGNGNVSYSATANNGGSVSYSLDATSLAAGLTIHPGTGMVNYPPSWVGTSIITASVAGCGGTLTATHSASSGNVYKQLYLSDPSQSLDRVHPGLVSPVDNTTASTSPLCVGAGPSASFDAPTDISNQFADHAITPDLAVHESGGVETVHMVFMSKASGAAKKNIYYSSKTGAGSWSSPVLISNDAFAQDAQSYPSIAVDANNKAYVVYAHKNGASDAKINIYYVTNASGSWSSPVRISNDGFAQDAYTPDIALNASGKAHVTYYHKNGASDSKYNIYYVTNASGSWSSPVRISNDGFNQDAKTNPAIAVDAANKAHVVYTHKNGASDAKINIYYVTNASGSWSSAARISNDGFNQDAQANPSIVLDENDKPHVVYAHKNGASDAKINIYYTNKTSGSWSTPLNLSNDVNVQDSKNPDLAVSTCTGIVRVAFSNEGKNIYYTENSGSGGSWTSPVDINPTSPTKSDSGENPSVAISSSNVHVVFEDKHISLGDKTDVWHLKASAEPDASFTTTTFTQVPALCSPLIIKGGQPITVTNYVSIISGAMPALPNITADIKYGTSTIISLSNPTYSGGLLTWSGMLLSDVTVPDGQAIALKITTAQTGVTFKIDYDSQTKPSKINLPVSTFIDITSYAVYSAPYPGGSIITSTVNGTTVYPRVVVTDPFGFSDITGLNITISPTVGTVIATSVATTGCTKTYQYTWNTPLGGGTYSLPATAKEGYENAVTDLQALNFDVCAPAIGNPVFALGTSSTRCQGAGTTTYSATSSFSTGMTYSLDVASAAAGNTINTSTGAVTYLEGWTGTSVITGSASGCGGPKTSSHTVTITPYVDAPVFTLGAASIRCQNAGTVTYTAAANNTTGITYSLDGPSISGGNSINTSNGAVTYVAGWSGSTTITASAAGCNGPKTTIHTVTTNAGVSAPVFALGASSGRCGSTGNYIYSATASNSISISYGLDATSLANGNSINPATGAVTFSSSWMGSSTITATAIGCNGNASATHTVSISSSCPPIAVDDAANGAGGAPIPINVLANDSDPNNNINPSSLSILTQPANGSAVISAGQVVYLPNGTYEGVDQFTYQVCDLTSPTPLCASATVIVTIDPTTVDACSEAVRRQVYYLPYPEQDARLALIASTGSAWLPIPSSNIRTIISLKIPYPGMTLVWDHWEDGYETDPNNPLQNTTQVWGDGNPYNGVAPGYSDDVLPAGAAIVLDNTMPSNPRVSTNIFYDGKDKIVSSGAITVTQVSGEPSIIFVQCMKTNVTPTANYGNSFTIPVGEDFNSQDFAYTALFIRASEDNTTINIDKDNNGNFETTTILNEGQSYFVNGGVLTGAIVTSSAPIGVDLHFGGKDGYSSREAPIFPATWYSDVYYTPVPSTQSPDSCVVMLYNSLNRSIDINWYFGTSSSGTVSLPAKTVKRFPLNVSSTDAYKFVNPTGESFTAIEIVDSYTPGGGGNSGSTFDWAFNLISEERLTSFAAIAWAPGSIDGTVNGNPIWITPAANTTIYVKYNGDLLNGGSISPCGLRYDVSYPLNELKYKKLLDSDKDQSGLAVYTCDGTKIAAAYGEDPALSVPANPNWDVGSTIQPFCGEKLILANDDRAYTLVGQPVTVPVLINDYGFLAVIDPNTLATLGYRQPSNGTVQVNSNGTLLYIPNPGFVGSDTLEYGICSTPGSPPNIVCDRALVIIDINACPVVTSQNYISGQIFLDKNKDGINNEDNTGFSPGKVYLYADGNCNGAINTGELVDSVEVDASGFYQFIRYPEKIVSDDFDGTGGASSCNNGSDGSASWATNWVDAGEGGSTGFCVSPAQSESNTDAEIKLDGAFGYALRLDDNNVSARRTVNLNGATYAFLSFSYRRASSSLSYGEDIYVQVSTNGSSYTTIYTISGDGSSDAGYVNIYNQNISAFAATTTYIRFLTNNSVDEGDFVFIDDVSIRLLKYPICYITQIEPSLIPADFNLTTAGEYAMTALNAGSCLASYDFGIAKNSTSISGTLYNDPNGLSDGLVNGTPFGSPSGATVYAYLVDATGKVLFKTTVNSGNGTFTFSQADVNSSFTLMASTTNIALYAIAPTSAVFPSGWVSTGEAYGNNNGAGTGNEAGTPNSIISVSTGYSAVTNVKIGIQLVNAGPDRTVCQSGTATMAATTTPGTWIAHSGNLGTATITTPTSPTTNIVSFSAAGDYFFLWTNNGISDTAIVSVAIDPAITAEPIGFTACVGANQAVSVTATGGVPPLAYQWQSSADNVSFANISGATDDFYFPLTSSPGTTYYRVIVTPNSGGCGSLISAVATVEIVDDPVITVPPTNITECLGVEQSLNVTATGGAPPLTYQWQSSTDNVTFNNVLGATASAYSPPANLVGTTYYKVIVGSNGNGCGTATSSSVTVTVTNPPTASLSSDTTICTSGSASLTAGASGGTAPYTFTWSNGLGVGSNKVVSPVATTTYGIIAIDAIGCTDSSQATVQVITCVEICDNGIDDDGDGLIDCQDDDCQPAPNAGFNVSICIGSSHTITATATGGDSPYTFVWDNGLGTGNSHSVTPLVTTTYHVSITSATGCTSVDSVIVTIELCPEDCTDGIDNDGDGLVDCDDPDCQAVGKPNLQPDVFQTCPGVSYREQVIFNDDNLQDPIFSIANNPTRGSVSIDDQGVFIYSPFSSYCGVDSFVYEVCNQVTGCCDIALVTLNVGDTLPPVLQNVPADITIGCDETVPAIPTSVFGMDGCPGIYMSFEEESTFQAGNACQNYTITRSWVATDLCGNTAIGSQIITVEDKTPPEIFRVYTMANGKRMAGGISQQMTHRWKFVKFPVNFSEIPLVFPQVVSQNENSAVNARIRNISEEGFEMRLQEEENADGTHAVEQVSWVAIERGDLSDGFKLQSGLLSAVNNSPTSFNFTDGFATIPAFIAAIQTYNEADPSAIRFSGLSKTKVDLFIQEEQSKDVEVAHAMEKVAYLAMDSGILKDGDETVVGETGSLNLNNNWKVVNLSRDYNKTVVILGGVETGNDPAVIRVRNVTKNSFEVKIQDWDYLHPIHPFTKVSYLVMEGSVPIMSQYFCDNNAIELAPGLNLFATDNCDNQIAFDYNDSSLYTETGLHINRTWTAVDDCGNSTVVNRTDTCSLAALRLRTMLYGPLISNVSVDVMKDGLRQSGYVPLTEPYTDLPNFHHVANGGGETVSQSLMNITGNDAIVDWVFVEVRDPVNKTTVLATQSALLQRDGDVMTPSGGSVLFFPNLQEGFFYVSVKHRNHLGILTEGVEYLNTIDPPQIDFTDQLYLANGANASGHIHANGYRAQWSGDLNGDSRVIFQGPVNDVFHLFSHVLSADDNVDYLANYISHGYHNEDLNMDGKAIFQGPNNDKSSILYHTILAHPNNQTTLANYIVTTSLP